MVATGLAIPLMVSLGGCQTDRTRPVLRLLGGTLYIAVGVSQDDIDFELQKEVRQRTAELQATFRALQPKVRLQVQVFAEQSLRNELRIRNRTGLSPDLLLVNQATARELASDRLISTVTVPAVVLDQLDTGSVQRVRRQDGSLIGIPVELQPQVACFDRRRIKRSPANLDELLAFSAKGMEVGFSLDAMNLAWTLGPLGAINAVSDLLAGKPATPMTRESLNGWLLWLRQADGQQHVTVFPSETELLKALIGGSLDWIPCRSINITRLRSRLGSHLGVAALPSGPFGEASPITRERVLSFGVNSSPEQRQLALALARFAVSPLHQRDLVLRNKYVLPVNLEIAPPVQSSSVVAAMVEGRDQSLRSATTRLDQGSSESQREGWQALLTRYLFDDLSQKEALEGLISLLSGGRQR